MTTDSANLLAALLLLAASLHAALAGAGAYLRFAAGLLAALALAAMAQHWTAGLGAAAALLVLPLAGTALGLSALARFGRRLPPMPAALLLMAALGCGLRALLGGGVILVLAPLVLGGAMVLFASLHRMALTAALAGLLLLGGASAFMVAGAGAASLSLLAAALAGLGVFQTVASSRPARFSPGRP